MFTQSGGKRRAAVEPSTIVAAAQQVIRERGMAGCTTRGIAQVAGCSEGSLYNHFASKEALVAAAIGDRFRSFPAAARSLAERAGTRDVATNLTDFARAAIEFFQEFLPLLGVMIAEPAQVRAHTRAGDAQGHGPRRTLEAVTQYLRREQELGRVGRDAPVEAAARCLLGGCFQHALLCHVLDPDLRPPGDGAEVAAGLVDALLHGLRPPGPGEG